MLFAKVIFVSYILVLMGCQATADSYNNQSKTGALATGVILQTDFDDDDDSRVNTTHDCPVGLVNGLTLDDEFGPGTAQITRCLHHTPIKVVYQINHSCRTSNCNRAYALGNISNAIKDYEITHGFTAGIDFEIVGVVHSGGFRLVLDNNAEVPFGDTNPFQDQMQSLLDLGVKIYFCQNTARGKGIVTANLIPGIQFVTAGVTAITDFQLMGYAYVQP